MGRDTELKEEMTLYPTMAMQKYGNNSGIYIHIIQNKNAIIFAFIYDSQELWKHCGEYLVLFKSKI